jgi:hypothetical protein
MIAGRADKIYLRLKGKWLRRQGILFTGVKKAIPECLHHLLRLVVMEALASIGITCVSAVNVTNSESRSVIVGRTWTTLRVADLQSVSQRCVTWVQNRSSTFRPFSP